VTLLFGGPAYLFSSRAAAAPAFSSCACADGYRAWTNQQDFAAPAPTALTKHGGWIAVRQLAQDELRREHDV
jgi:hypothetical protein